MGAVYRAEQAGLARAVALKVLKRELVVERETVARFEREAKAMSMLLHSNTVRVFDFGEDPSTGHLFLAMELLEGELLTARNERGGVRLSEAIDLIVQVLRSLAEAHHQGIVHRDLKPDNIFLARIPGHSEPIVKVLDFGIAKAFRNDERLDQLETQAGTVFGTPRYMSPEQAQGKPPDPRSDLYSVGVLFYQLITGRAPFVDEDAVVVMAKHIREKPIAPRRLAPDAHIPESLEAVVMKALEKSAAKRFSTGEEFEQALLACRPEAEAVANVSTLANDSQPLSTRSSTDLLEIRGRNRWVPVAAGVAAVLMVGAGAIGWALVSGTSPRAIAASSLPDQASGATEQPERISAVSEPTTHRVRIESRPPGANVTRNGSALGDTPIELAVEPTTTDVVIVARMGYQPVELGLAGASDLEVVELSPIARDELDDTPDAEQRRSSRRIRRRPTLQVSSTPRETAPAPAPPPLSQPVAIPPAETSSARRAPQPSDDPYERFE